MKLQTHPGPKTPVVTSPQGGNQVEVRQGSIVRKKDLRLWAIVAISEPDRV